MNDTITIDRKVVEQALEALESCNDGDYSTGHVIHPSFNEKDVNAAITAIRTAIEQAKKVEPVFVVFDGPPSHEAGRFVEVETACGKSINVGEWHEYPADLPMSEGLWRLGPFYTTPQPAIPAGYALVPVKLPREVETSIWMEGFNDVSDAWECFLRKLAAAPKPENSHD